MSQDSQTLKTVTDVWEYVQPLIDDYRRFQSRKLSTAQKLKVVFSSTSPFLSIVVKDGKFVESFQRKMGKGRMRALKKVLLELDSAYYQQIDFRCD